MPGKGSQPWCEKLGFHPGPACHKPLDGLGQVGSGNMQQTCLSPVLPCLVTGYSRKPGGLCESDTILLFCKEGCRHPSPITFKMIALSVIKGLSSSMSPHPTSQWAIFTNPHPCSSPAWDSPVAKVNKNIFAPITGGVESGNCQFMLQVPGPTPQAQWSLCCNPPPTPVSQTSPRDIPAFFHYLQMPIHCGQEAALHDKMSQGRELEVLHTCQLAPQGTSLSSGALSLLFLGPHGCTLSLPSTLLPLSSLPSCFSDFLPLPLLLLFRPSLLFPSPNLLFSFFNKDILREQAEFPSQSAPQHSQCRTF